MRRTPLHPSPLASNKRHHRSVTASGARAEDKEKDRAGTSRSRVVQVKEERQQRFERAIFNSISDFKLTQNILHNYGGQALPARHLKLLAELMQPEVRREQTDPVTLSLVQGLFRLVGSQDNKLTVGQMFDLQKICEISPKEASALMAGRPDISSADLATLIQSYGFSHEQIYHNMLQFFQGEKGTRPSSVERQMKTHDQPQSPALKRAKLPPLPVDVKSVLRMVSKFGGGSYSAATMKKAIGKEEEQRLDLRWLVETATSPSKKFTRKAIVELQKRD